MDGDYWAVLLVDGRDRFPAGMKQVVVDKRQSGRFDGKDQRAIAQEVGCVHDENSPEPHADVRAGQDNADADTQYKPEVLKHPLPLAHHDSFAVLTTTDVPRVPQVAVVQVVVVVVDNSRDTGSAVVAVG